VCVALRDVISAEPSRRARMLTMNEQPFAGQPRSQPHCCSSTSLARRDHCPPRASALSPCPLPVLSVPCLGPPEIACPGSTKHHRHPRHPCQPAASPKRPFVNRELYQVYMTARSRQSYHSWAPGLWKVFAVDGHCCSPGIYCGRQGNVQQTYAKDSHALDLASAREPIKEESLHGRRQAARR
jgi:hypothetical protein